jgi:hypothetical protein
VLAIAALLPIAWIVRPPGPSTGRPGEVWILGESRDRRVARDSHHPETSGAIPLLPFAKRPPPPEEQVLATGDFEAYQRPTLPPAPRLPVFDRAMPPQSFQPYSAMMSAPPPPNSLAPVAMPGVGTGPYPRSAETVMVRAQSDGSPSMRYGVMIAIAGALIGGALGVTMNRGARAPRPSAVAATVEQAAPPAPAPQAIVTSQLANAGPTILPQSPPLAPRQAYATAGTALPVQAPVVVPAKTESTPAPKSKHHAYVPPAPHANGGGGMLASKVSAPPPPPKTEKAEKPEPPAPKGNSDAVDLLNRAKKESSLSL